MAVVVEFRLHVTGVLVSSFKTLKIGLLRRLRGLGPGFTTAVGVRWK